MSVEEKLCVKILANMLSYATNQIMQIDDEFKEKMSTLNHTIQWKIGNDLNYYSEMKEGKSAMIEGETDNPTITFKVADAEVALKVLGGQAEIDKMDKDVEIIGEASKISELMFVLDTLRKYLGDMRD